jgi:hypothetical protein
MEKTLEVGILSVVNQTARILSKSLSFEEGAEEFLKGRGRKRSVQKRRRDHRKSL